jgi:GntR family histidine utilization transcriptional repressor
VPWTEAEHRISALGAATDVARRLEVDERTACLALERRTWRGRQRITHVRQIFPGTVYDLIARFEPAPARDRLPTTGHARGAGDSRLHPT